MNDLITKLIGTQKDIPVVSSLQVAEHFHKRHTHVLRAIEKAIPTQPKNGLSERAFFKSAYSDDSGKKNPMYWMNRDGFAFIVMGFTGEKAAEWKWKYIDAFNQMEKVVREKHSETWLETRKQGKLTRRSETDTVKELIEYAKGQGSKHSHMLYVTYSKLANKMAGIENRDLATVKQLNSLDEVEGMILHVIRLGMAGGKHYKEIYADCKRRLEFWQDCTFRLTA